MNFKVTKEKCIKLNEFLENDSYINFDRKDVEDSLDLIKKVYKIIRKNDFLEKQTFYKATTMAEIDKIKINSDINRFVIANSDISHAKEEFANVLNRPILLQIEINSDVPRIELDENIVIIPPFTKVEDIQEIQDDSEIYKIYKIVLSNQQKETFEEDVIAELYEGILENVDSISAKIKECLEIDEENSSYYENIRKLEQLIAKHQFAMEQEDYDQDTTDEEKQSDLDDIARINSELTSLKEMVTNSFNDRLKKMQFISEWKNDIFSYLKSEFNEIDNKENNKTAKKEIENIDIEKQEDEEQEDKENERKPYEPTGNEEVDNVFLSCYENIETVDNLIKNIKDLILRQQNHARIAGSLDSNYKALNNAFEMKNVAEELSALVESILNKANNTSTEDTETLNKIAEVNLQISTLLNYLNNAKSAVSKKINRFDEINIIEENELKKEIAETVKNIRCEAELKKLHDDLDIIEDKSNFRKFLGKITGRSKLDKTMIDQIEVRQTAIRKNFKMKLPLAHNYSIHEIIAEIDMFIKENKDDELVAEDVSTLRKMKDILKKNFVIIDSKVMSIVDQKTGRNLPVASRKVSKKELIEIDTYRFLNRYGYDKTIDTNEPEYQDTMANEINRIVEYIKSSEIL